MKCSHTCKDYGEPTSPEVCALCNVEVCPHCVKYRYFMLKEISSDDDLQMFIASQDDLTLTGICNSCVSQLSLFINVSDCSAIVSRKIVELNEKYAKDVKELVKSSFTVEAVQNEA